MIEKFAGLFLLSCDICGYRGRGVMANYYKQCECKRMTDKVPCYDCLEAENKRLRERLNAIIHLCVGASATEEVLDHIKCIARGE